MGNFYKELYVSIFFFYVVFFRRSEINDIKKKKYSRSFLTKINRLPKYREPLPFRLAHATLSSSLAVGRPQGQKAGEN